MELKQTIDFSVPNPSATANYSLPLYQGCDYNPPYRCWSINYVQGFFKFNLYLATKQGVNLIFQLCSADVHGVSNCPINLTVNGNLLIGGFDPHIDNFYDVVWSVPADMLQAGNNEIRLTLAGGTTKVFMRLASVDMYQVPVTMNNWLSTVPDTMPLTDINLPGTHDSAAINTTIHTPYACHNMSITNQLNGGIRILDVRLKVKKNNNAYEFVTCHGDIGSSTTLNEYQSLPSLLDECNTFLGNNKTEVVVMTLKVDDWSTYGNDQVNVLNALYALLGNYPVNARTDIPQLKDVRGKIFLYNRINDDLRFGAPISWSDNTSGSYASVSSNRLYNVYVQDQYKGLPTFGSEQAKYNLVKAAFSMKKTGEMLLNFASATWYGVIGVYIMGDVLGFFGQYDAPNRLKMFGWTMFDYEFEQYQSDTYGWMNVVDLIISSNFSYAKYPNKYSITGHDEL